MWVEEEGSDDLGWGEAGNTRRESTECWVRKEGGDGDRAEKRREERVERRRSPADLEEIWIGNGQMDYEGGYSPLSLKLSPFQGI